MNLSDLISPKLTFNNVDSASKKRLFNYLAEYVHNEYPEISEERIYQGLIQRERLGSTGIGLGVGIPHCRVENCHTMIGVLLKLAGPIPFDAIDAEPVDIVFALIAPIECHQTHLDTLSNLASLFSKPSVLKNLRHTKNKQQLYDTFHQNLVLDVENSTTNDADKYPDHIAKTS